MFIPTFTAWVFNTSSDKKNGSSNLILCRVQVLEKKIKNFLQL
jgi:hypothetical protein